MLSRFYLAILAYHLIIFLYLLNTPHHNASCFILLVSALYYCYVCRASRASVYAAYSATGACCTIILLLKESLPLALLTAVCPLGCWISEMDRRRITKEIVIYTTAARVASIQSIREYDKRAKKGIPDAFASMKNDTFYLVDSAIDQQRQELIDLTSGATYDNATILFSVLFLCTNLLICAFFWSIDPGYIAVIMSYVVTLGMVAKVSNAVVNDLEIGGAAAAPLLERPSRVVYWSAFSVFGTLVCSQSAPALLSCLYQVLCAVYYWHRLARNSIANACWCSLHIAAVYYCKE